MNLRQKKRLASKILKCGKNKIWIDPEFQEEVNDAITKRDIRNLIKKGAIKKRKEKGQSGKKRRKKQGKGSRKGKKGARKNSKREWIKKIRALRKELKSKREKEEISKSEYRKLYKMAKGNFFRNKAHLRNYIQKKLK